MLENVQHVNTFLQLGIYLIVFITLWMTISSIRIYKRTKMRSFLFFLIAGSTICIGLLVIQLDFESFINFLGKETKGIGIIISLCFIALGFILESFGFALLVTEESGAWREVSKRTTFIERFLGNVPTIEKSKYHAVIKKKQGISFGILMLGIGIIFVLISLNNSVTTSSIILSIVFLTKGILLIAYSLIKLSGKDSARNWRSNLYS